ncbi:NUDIX domain-containing protein [Lentilactobacillus hilgardii]|uniref:NUDIX domain-containing protein n=1 Tax=Lentilactobacillus hilgardii TaxID=1588 RepID=UPI00288C46AC|nr:NUDIX domain-containing protein [Lentilactobacillus hilgardii]
MIEVNNSLIVIKKNGGPYINRYDLPGGSLEDGEALQNAIIRKIKEETGLVLKEITQLGIKSFRYPWTYQKWQYNQLICVFYQIFFHGRCSQRSSFSICWSKFPRRCCHPLDRLTLANSSPRQTTHSKCFHDAGLFVRPIKYHQMLCVSDE